MENVENKKVWVLIKETNCGMWDDGPGNIWTTDIIGIFDNKILAEKEQGFLDLTVDKNLCQYIIREMTINETNI